MADDGDSPKLEPQSGNRMVRAVRRMMERGRSGLELRQLNKDLDHFWLRLGKTAYHLVVAGEIDHPALRKAMERIEELEGRIDVARAPADPSAKSERDPSAG